MTYAFKPAKLISRCRTKRWVFGFFCRSPRLVKECVFNNFSMFSALADRKRREQISLSHVDLFSGCGGLSLGFKRSGSIPIAAIDSDLHACATFQRNNPSTPVHCGDVFDFVSSNKRRFRGVDFLIGGPPCQGFCAINPKRTENDPRNSGLDQDLPSRKYRLA